MKALRDSQGQGMVEALLTLPLLMAALICLALLSYRALVFYSADYLLHEALICSSYLSPQNCEKDLKAGLQRLLLGGEIQRAEIYKSPHEAHGLVQLNLLKSSLPRLQPFEPSLKIQKRLELPIQVR